MGSEIDLQRLEQVFQQAADLPAAQREAFLDRTCGDETELRTRVEAMLGSLEDGASLSLNDPGLARVTEGAGTVIDRYKLLQVIGEGGFGVVYMAEQLQPVRRKVALKIIKLGMDTKEVVARFEAERQALAMMDHPHIAKVLDGGATETGRPYFVMELVRGVSITAYCDKNGLTTQQRIDLFLPVCQAVQHAHQKGVIHRDLKPSNVMVTLHDGVPVPKIIDFGIAKAMHTSLTERTLFTAYERFIGTPAYMSPEQAELSGLDVDTRTDIYSLGVLLYELLTGTTPFDTQQLRQAGLSEIQRILREDTPPRPSVRISTSQDATVAATRKLDIAGLSKRLAGDLDWIVMKALEKDRARRYDTALELGDDLRRHLEDEPVLAGPPSQIYRLRKLFAKHRGAAVSITVVTLALVGGLVGIGTGYVHTRDALELAEEETARAEASARLASEVTDFLVDTLALTNAGVSLQADLSVRTLLDRTARRLDTAFGTEPAAEARLRATIGRAYTSLGEHETAERHLRRALELSEAFGEADPVGLYDALWSLTHICFYLERQDAFAVAQQARVVGLELIGRQAPVLADLQRRFIQAVEAGAHQRDAESMLPAEALFPRCLEQAAVDLPPGDPMWLVLCDGFAHAGYALWYTPNEGHSEAYWRAVLDIRRRELSPNDGTTNEALSQLVGVLSRAGRGTDAEAEMRAGLEALQQAYAGDSVQVAYARQLLGQVLLTQQRWDEAEALLVGSHEIIIESVGDPSSFYAVEALGRVVRLYEDWGREERAAPFRDRLAAVTARGRWVQVWPVQQLVYGPEHAELRAALDALVHGSGGFVYAVVGGEVSDTDFGPEVDRVVAALSRLPPSSNRAIISARCLLGLAQGYAPHEGPGALGSPRGRLLVAADSILRGCEDDLPLTAAEARAGLAQLLVEEGERGRARMEAQAAAELVDRAPRYEHWFVVAVQARIVRAFLAVGMVDQAEALLVPGRELMIRQLGAAHPETQAVEALLAEARGRR